MPNVTKLAETTWRSWREWFSRHVLLLAILFLVPAFLGTRALVAGYRAMEHRLSATWYEQGETDLRAGAVSRAVDDFRAALAFSREAPSIRLRLAQVLVRAGHFDAANADLLRLWEDQPASGIINLELARLAVRRDHVADAIRYFNNAIYGVWPNNPDERRRQTQLELIDYLLANRRDAEAQAQLIALSADAPPDPDLRLALGERFLRVGGDAAALQEFSLAAETGHAEPGPRSIQALQAAGTTAFRLGQLQEAARDLDRASRAGDRSPDTARLLAAARAAIEMNPFARDLSSGERVRRVRKAFDVAMRSFASCAGPLLASQPEASVLNDPAYQASLLHGRFARLGPVLATTEARDAQVQQDVMDVVFDIEQFVAANCGSTDVDDAALLALARARRRQP